MWDFGCSGAAPSCRGATRAIACPSGKRSLDEREPRWAWRRRPTRCCRRNVTGLDSLVKVASRPVEDQRLVRRIRALTIPAGASIKPVAVCSPSQTHGRHVAQESLLFDEVGCGVWIDLAVAPASALTCSRQRSLWHVSLRSLKKQPALRNPSGISCGSILATARTRTDRFRLVDLSGSIASGYRWRCDGAARYREFVADRDFPTRDTMVLSIRLRG